MRPFSSHPGWPGIITILLAVGTALTVGGYESGATLSSTRSPRPAPPFSALDLHGRAARVVPGKEGRTLLLFFCMCSNCQRLAAQWRPHSRGGGVPNFRVVGVIHCPLPQAAIFEEATRFPGTLLVDPTGAVHDEYRAGSCPNAWLVDRGGAVRFARSARIGAAELGHRTDSWARRRPAAR
jgi:peroxiredoxin